MSEKDTGTIYTVPPHVGQNIEVPMGSHVTFYNPTERLDRNLRVLVCGSRDYPNYGIILSELRTLKETRGVIVVIQGAASGVDTAAAHAARCLGIPVESYPADWNQYGRSAGPIRNRQMLVDGKPDLVLAFATKTLTESKGTRNMVEQARAAGVKVRVFEGSKA